MKRRTVATRDQVKAEIERVEDDYLDVLYRMILSLEGPSGGGGDGGTWSHFVASTYGSLSDAPIERGGQGELAARDLLR